MPSSIEWECDSTGSFSSSSDSSPDEDQLNARLTPCWSEYRALISSKGYRLDTVRDVRDYYLRHGVDTDIHPVGLSEYLRVHTASDDNALCRDPGLPDNMFRATCCATSGNLVIKAVNRLSREAQHIRYMSSSRLRHDPMNHCIPVLEVIDVPTDDICFIVMEEWSSHLLPVIPPRLRDFLSMLHQCIEHVAFMHRNHMAHLDISLRNFLTDYGGRCACIDYELSQKVEDQVSPGAYCQKGTETPPELECDQGCNPYMVDVWALGTLILNACKTISVCVPELLYFTRPMLHHDPEKRPSAVAVLQEFRLLVLSMSKERLDQPC